jgi:hypothetical protein
MLDVKLTKLSSALLAPRLLRSSFPAMITQPQRENIATTDESKHPAVG